MTAAVSLSTPTSHPKALHVALWGAQLVLAALFLMAGVMKTTTPLAELAAQMPLATDAPALLRFIGASELAGAIGLVLPAATRIKPWLTPLAAAALLLVMVLAALYHLMRGEIASIGVNVLLGGLAAFVVWGRTRRARIAARS